MSKIHNTTPLSNLTTFGEQLAGVPKDKRISISIAEIEALITESRIEGMIEAYSNVRYNGVVGTVRLEKEIERLQA